MDDKTTWHGLLLDNLQRSLVGRVGAEVVRIETHISTVLLAGDYAYKIKKPVDLGFLDFSTLERRRFCCQEELRLNRRLAPSIYLEVVPVTGAPEHPALAGQGEIIDYAVKMRRFSQSGLLSNQVAKLDAGLIVHLAMVLAGFHGEIERAGEDQPYGEPRKVLFPMQQNFLQIRNLLDVGWERAQLDRLESWTLAHFAELEEFLSRRKQMGFIRECHGDLHLGNIALEKGRPIIFDGIEFNPDLRWIDTMSELAFILMDLEEKGRPELAQRLLNSYFEASGDYEGAVLLRFYQVYRAMVRAKVAAIRLSQSDLAGPQRTGLQEEFSAYLRQASGYTLPGAPALIVTHGLSGSGKSTVTAELMMQLPAVRLRSDVERKRLAGLAAGADSRSATGAGIYTADFTERTYQRLLELSEILLRAGFIVIVDATLLKSAQRRRFQDLAAGYRVPYLILNFVVPETELRRRVALRSSHGEGVSEADIGVLEAQLKVAEPVVGEECDRVLTVSPHRPLVIDDVRRLIGRHA